MRTRAIIPSAIRLRRALALVLAYAVAALPPARAEAPAEPSDALRPVEELDLGDLLHTRVEIASGVKESAALAASMVTVIDRARIDRLGARTLEQLLQHVVGFDTRRGEHNDWKVALRGYDSAANFLVMVDGQRLNDAYDGSVPWDVPLANVRRIEIIRGPGSAVFGSNAYVGVIHLVTFDDEAPATEVRAWGGSQPSDFASLARFTQPLGGAAGRTGWQFGNGLRLDAHATFERDTGSALLVPSDNASLRNEPWSLARCVDASGAPVRKANGFPILRVNDCAAAGGSWNGRTQNAVTHGEGALRLKFREFEWTTRLSADGRDGGLTDPNTNHLFLAYQSHRTEVAVASQLSWTHELAPSHRLKLRALATRRRQDELLGLAPAGFTSAEGTVFPDGLAIRTSFPSTDLGLEATSEHEFTLSEGFFGHLAANFGLGFDRRQVGAWTYESNFGGDPQAPRAFADASATLPALDYEGTARPRPECAGGRVCAANRFANVSSAFAQARWQPELGIAWLQAVATLGLRVDDDTSVGFVPSPRAGLAFAFDDEKLDAPRWVRWILPDNVKLLYGTAFRAPTFQEHFDNVSQTSEGNPDLVAERIRSLEAGLGYGLGEHGSLFANFYDSHIDHSIQAVHSSGGIEPLRQRELRDVEGLELEIHGAAGRLVDGFANLGWFDGTDTGTIAGSDVPQVSHLEDQAHLRAGGGFEASVSGCLSVGGSATYTGERQNSQRTPTEQTHVYTIPAFALVNAALHCREPVPGLSFSLFARNVLGTSYRDPLVVQHEADVKVQAGDKASALLTREGLSMFLSVSYRPVPRSPEVP